jgi:hypothetical protein
LKHRRSGKSLIELVIVLTVLIAVMTPAARLMYTLMRSEREGIRGLAVSANMARLSRELRRDVHAALGAELVAPEGDAPARLRLRQADDRVVTYAPGTDRVTRTVADEAGETSSREAFHLPDGAGTFEVSSEPRLVVFTHKRSRTSESTSASEAIRVEAVPGRDHRFTE